MPTDKSNSYSSSKKRLFTAMGTVIERHSFLKCREQLIAVDSAQQPEIHPRHNPPYTHTPCLTLREHSRRRWQGYKNQRREEVCCQVVPLRSVTEASLLIAQLHGCLSKTGPKIIPMNAPVWRGVFHRAPSQGLSKTNTRAEKEKISHLRDIVYIHTISGLTTNNSIWN